MLTIDAQGSGDCAIYIYMIKNPQIFDVVKVKVSSIVRPLSPVYLHIGGDVDFKVINSDDLAPIEDFSQKNWKSTDPTIL